MAFTGKVLLGGILLLAGCSMLLQLVGIHKGSLISVFVAGSLILAGIRNPQKGRKILGGGILLFGLLFLLGAAHVLFQLLFAFLIIYLGVKWLSRSKNGESFVTTTKEFFLRKKTT